MSRDDAFKDLKSLRHWKEAEDRLKQGASGVAVARYLHQMGELTDVREDTLARRLNRYRAKNFAIKPLRLNAIDRMYRHLVEAFDDIQEMTKLILVQRDRVAKDLKLETNMPKLAPWLLKEISLLFDMIERRARLLQDLGLLPKEPEKHTVAFFGDSTWVKFLDTLDPAQRARAREILQMDYARKREAQEAQLMARFRHTEAEDDFPDAS